MIREHNTLSLRSLYKFVFKQNIITVHHMDILVYIIMCNVVSC